MFIGYINMTIIEKDNLSDIPGVGPATALKLEAAGFTDFASIGVASSKEIAEKCEIGEATAVKIIAAARSMAKIGDFISAATLKEQRSKLRRLTTGSKALDNLFKNPRNDQGGLESASITEFFGEFGSGKCCAEDTPILYFDEDGVGRVERISYVYEKYESSVAPYDGGESFVPSKEIKVLSYDGRVIGKQSISGFYREWVNEIEAVKTSRGNNIKLTKNHPLLTMTNEGMAWKSLGLLDEGDYIAYPLQVDYTMVDESITPSEEVLGWEKIESITTIEYNDYVYDIMVDKTHNFIGGEKPTILHNTQLCFQLAVNTTMPVERGGLDADALIIDTEGTFRPARIEQIAIAQDLDPDKVLDHIHVARAFNSAHQMLLLENKAYELAKECNVGLIIIDSLTSHFRSEFVGRGNLAERQGQLAKHMRELLRYTYLNNCVGVITNQVMANPGQLFGDPTKPVGGHVLGHASTNRLYLRKAGKGGKRNARMIDSPEVVEDEVIFVVSEAGIRDE